MRLYRPTTIREIMRAVIEDEFDDSAQNVEIYGGEVFGVNEFVLMCSRNIRKGRVLEVGCGSGYLLQKLPITHAIEPHPIRRQRAIEKGSAKVKAGVIECIPYPSDFFSTVICHGTWCLVRSQTEALVEVNRVLAIGGRFILDVVVSTNLPISRVDTLSSLVKMTELFGFSLVEIQPPIENLPHLSVGLCIEKTRNFDWRQLRMPQTNGKIRNYLHERDWYLR